MTKPLSWKIAEAAFAQFDKLPRKAKPRVQSADGNSIREWTTMSAVVVVHDAGVEQDQKANCVCLATGTKCLPATAIPACQGSVIHDSHAEILALRGFNRWLLAEMKRILDSDNNDDEYESPILCRFSNSNSNVNANAKSNGLEKSIDDNYVRPFQIRDDVSIHLFATEAPCGDASMELLIKSKDPEDAVPWPVRESELQDNPSSLLGRGHFSILGAIRRKPSRSDAAPSLSKSCTDKLALKQFTGILSFPADLFIAQTPQSFLKSIVIPSYQFDEISYERAFSRKGRLLHLREYPAEFFSIDVLSPDFPRFEFEKTANPVDPAGKRPKASNLSALWISGSSHSSDGILEILLNGVKQGYQRLDTRTKRESVVCRRMMWKLGSDIETLLEKNKTKFENLNEIPRSIDGDSYEAAKTSPIRQHRLWLKSSIIDRLGKWERNIGDDQWELSSL